jgi:hypothetical protein
MRTTMIRQLSMLKLMWIVAVSARLFAADPRIGNWKLVSADSALDPPRVLSITHAGKGVHVVISMGTTTTYEIFQRLIRS